MEHHRNICALSDFPSGHPILPCTRSYNSLINTLWGCFWSAELSVLRHSRYLKTSGQTGLVWEHSLPQCSDKVLALYTFTHSQGSEVPAAKKIKRKPVYFSKNVVSSGFFWGRNPGKKGVSHVSYTFYWWLFLVFGMQSTGCWENSLFKQQVLKCRAGEDFRTLIFSSTTWRRIIVQCELSAVVLE